MPTSAGRSTALDQLATDELEAAQRSADAAAATADVRVEVAEEPASLRAVAQLLAQVWVTPPGHDPLASDVLRGLAHAGGAIHVAYRGLDTVGATAATFCPPSARAAYSMIAAARSSDRGVGFALKLAQRAWALSKGATSIRWTFDPLLSRNARFNLVKLGAVATDYTVDFYGPMNDGVNREDETDRLAALWTLTSRQVCAAAAGRPQAVGAPDLHDVELGPVPAPDGGLLTARDEAGLWCRVPVDIVAIRRRDPALAARWRNAVRDVFLAGFADGLDATGMTRDGWYRLTPKVQR